MAWWRYEQNRQRDARWMQRVNRFFLGVMLITAAAAVWETESAAAIAYLTAALAIVVVEWLQTRRKRRHGALVD